MEDRKAPACRRTNLWVTPSDGRTIVLPENASPETAIHEWLHSRGVLHRGQDPSNPTSNPAVNLTGDLDALMHPEFVDALEAAKVNQSEVNRVERATVIEKLASP